MAFNFPCFQTFLILVPEKKQQVTACSAEQTRLNTCLSLIKVVLIWETEISYNSWLYLLG